MEPIPAPVLDPVRAAAGDAELRPCLEPTTADDSDHPAVIAYARRETAGLTDPREIAIRLYYAVRDGIR